MDIDIGALIKPGLEPEHHANRLKRPCMYFGGWLKYIITPVSDVKDVSYVMKKT